MNYDKFMFLVQLIYTNKNWSIMVEYYSAFMDYYD